MIQTKDLSCIYDNGEEKQIIFEKQNIKINDGDFVIITGASGSGKSSLLKILSGLQKPTSGTVFWNNEDLYNLPDTKLSHLRLKESGFVYQDFMLIEELNGYDNIALVQNLINDINRNVINEIIKKLKIESLMKKYPKVLSGGEKQKISIARALANMPKIIFCDEPTGSLDYKSSKEIMDLLAFLNKEYSITIVLVTHELENLVYGNKFIKFEKLFTNIRHSEIYNHSRTTYDSEF